MQRMISSGFVSVLLGGFTVVAAQLPPEITVDRYLLQPEELMAEKDQEAALEVMNKIVALQGEHDLTLPGEFHFQYAQVAFSAGSIKVALESVNQYLAPSGNATQYALNLLLRGQPTNFFCKPFRISAASVGDNNCANRIKGAHQ